jgi:hypothetical protein
MSEWSFLVPPDITVTVRARRKPALLARCLDDETAPVADPALLLDLEGPAESGRTAGGRYKGIPWRCGVAGLPNGGLALSWRSRLLSEYLSLHIALLPALERLLAERDVALVVGAAFEMNGEATVLAGETGAGKTTALLTVLDAGACLVGDEYVGVSTAGEVSRVLRVIALRQATLHDTPGLSGRLSGGRRCAVSVSALAAWLTGRRLDPLVHVSPEEVGAKTAEEGRISTLCWLERTNANEPRCEPLRAEEVIQALDGMRAAHDRAYGGLAAVLPPLDVARWRETLARGLRDARCVKIELARGPLPAGTVRDLVGQTKHDVPARTSG